MQVKIQCPHCGRKLRVADQMVGQTIHCVACNRLFMFSKEMLRQEGLPGSEEVLAPKPWWSPTSQQAPSAIPPAKRTEIETVLGSPGMNQDDAVPLVPKARHPLRWLFLLCSLLQLPLLSFFKPVLGQRSLMIWAACCWMLTVLIVGIPWVIRLIARLWSSAPSWLVNLQMRPGLARGWRTIALLASILAAVEVFTPGAGLLASLLPPVSRAQFDLLRRLQPPSPEKEFTEVLADGQGTDFDQALNEAFRDAVQRTIGTVVDNKILIENDKIITDRILTYSNGYISDYQVLRTVNKKGIFHVNIRATVRQEKLLIRLHDSKVALTNISGSQLYAKISTRQKLEEDALRMLQVRLGSYPKGILTLDIPRDYSTDVKTPGDDKGAIDFLYSIKMKFDLDRYNLFVKQLDEILGQAATEKAEIQLRGGEGQEAKNQGPRGINRSDIATHKVDEDEQKKFATSPQNSSETAPLHHIFINIHRDKLSRRTLWTRYAVSESIYRKIRDKLVSTNNPLTVRTRLLDKDGRLITTDEYGGLNKSSGEGALGWTPGAAILGAKAILIGPFFFNADLTSYWGEADFQAKLPISIGEIKNLSSITAEISFKD